MRKHVQSKLVSGLLQVHIPTYTTDPKSLKNQKRYEVCCMKKSKSQCTIYQSFDDWSTGMSNISVRKFHFEMNWLLQVAAAFEIWDLPVLKHQAETELQLFCVWNNWVWFLFLSAEADPCLYQDGRPVGRSSHARSDRQTGRANVPDQWLGLAPRLHPTSW